MERQILIEERHMHNLIFRKMRSPAEDDSKHRGFRLQGMIISYLCEHAGERICQKDLETEFFVRGSTMAAALGQLEQEGYIVRNSDTDDRRLKVVTPTPKAEDAYRRLSERFKSMEKSLVKGISREELSVYFRVVDRICNNLEAEDQ